MTRTSPFGDDYTSWRDGSRSLSLTLVEGRWWMQVAYPDAQSTEPSLVRIAHQCPKESPYARAFINSIPMYDITGPGISYHRNIACNLCGETGMLSAGKWLPLDAGITEELLPVQGQPVDPIHVPRMDGGTDTFPADEEWDWYHSDNEDGSGASKHVSRDSAEHAADHFGGYVFKARPLKLIRVTERES